MKSIKKLTAIFSLSIAIAGGAQVVAAGGEQPGVNLSPVTGTPVPVRGAYELDAAMIIAERGRLAKDPLMLLAAARAVLMIGGTPGTDTGTEGAADDAKPASGPSQRAPGEKDLAKRLLGEAKIFARGDQATLGYIRQTEETMSRGTVAGAHKHDFRVGARRYQEYPETYRAGQLAEAAVVGDGDTDLDLEVFDDRGNSICKSDTRGDREYCRWTPVWTGVFTIRITNYGSVYNNATLVVN